MLLRGTFIELFIRNTQHKKYKFKFPRLALADRGFYCICVARQRCQSVKVSKCQTQKVSEIPRENTQK